MNNVIGCIFERKSKIYSFLILVCSLFLSSCEDTDSGIEDIHMCSLNENVLEFEKYLSTRYGGKLTFEDIRDLQSDFLTIKEDFVVDPGSSEKQKLRYTGLSKSCKSHDGVKYKLLIGVLNHLDGSNSFQELFINYDKSVFLAEKRPFSFSKMFGSKSDYQDVLSHLLVGKLNRSEVKDYLESLGCSFKGSVNIEKNGDLMELYIYSINPSKSLASIVGMWDFSKKISVSYNANNIVKKIQIK